MYTMHSCLCIVWTLLIYLTISQPQVDKTFSVVKPSESTPEIMIDLVPTIPGPYYIGSDLTLMCTVTLVPDDRDYDVNIWMSGPTFSDDNPMTIKTSQRQYTRLEMLRCINHQYEGSYTCRAGLTESPDVETTATINIEILGMFTYTNIISLLN